MNKLNFSLLLTLTLLFTSSLNAQNKPLDIDDIESWKRITETVLSPDGRWIAYKTEPSQGDSKIYLYSSVGEKRFELECGKNLQVTDDSAFMLFTVGPRYIGKARQIEPPPC